MASQPQTQYGDYVVADIDLADFGRKEIEIAETEMPGLMALELVAFAPAVEAAPAIRLRRIGVGSVVGHGARLREIAAEIQSRVPKRTWRP